MASTRSVETSCAVVERCAHVEGQMRRQLTIQGIPVLCPEIWQNTAFSDTSPIGLLYLDGRLSTAQLYVMLLQRNFPRGVVEASMVHLRMCDGSYVMFISLVRHFPNLIRWAEIRITHVSMHRLVGSVLFASGGSVWEVAASPMQVSCIWCSLREGLI